MVPKESGFNQSEMASGYGHAHCDVFQARLPWQGMAKLTKCSIFIITETQLPSKVRLCTTKQHGTSTCGYKNNAIFSDRAIFKFPAVYVCRPRYSGRSEALAVHTKLERWQHC